MAELRVLRTAQEVESLIDYLKDKDVVSYDCETTGVIKGSEVIGYSICADLDIAYYVIISAWDKEQNKLIVQDPLAPHKRLIESLKDRRLVMHNAVFDCSMAQDTWGVELMPSVHVDTMLLAHLLDENRSVGLKELGISIFGEDAAEEQRLMKASVTANGGTLTRSAYELYKADPDLLGRYGAQDTLLTLKLLYHFIPDLFDQKLDDFFFQETMPLLRTATYDLNRTGLKVDTEKLQQLKRQLQSDCLEAQAYIQKEVYAHVKDKYPGTGKTNHFNIGSSTQLAWLLFDVLRNPFEKLTEEGRNVAKALQVRLPYTPAAKREFIRVVLENKDQVYEPALFNPKTKKMGRPKKVKDYWNYLACGKETLGKFSDKYKWVSVLLKYAKDKKLLNTYVEGIEEKLQYGVIRPSFLQHGTTSGRYSSKAPNFQNLPRDDKRVKACIVARPGKVFVGADQSQLEPRVFASISQDETLMGCFSKGEDFYSVVGAPVFGVKDATLVKDDSPNSFPVKYKKLRDRAKVVALATPYGRTAAQQSSALGIGMEESQAIIDRYFEAYPKVELMMLESHEQAKTHGVVYSLYGRPRRIPEAKLIAKRYGKNTPHGELPYMARTPLNLAMNHRVQSTGASIMNRAAIQVWKDCRELESVDKAWKDVKIVLQVHDELILEGPEHLAEDMGVVLKNAMEDTVELPGVSLEAEPKISNNLADLK